MSATSQTVPQAADSSLALPADCLITDAAALKASLAGLLEQPQNVTLDASSLQRIDTAALQLVAAFVRERAEHGRTVQWQGAEPVMAGAARLLGLTTILKLPA